VLGTAVTDASQVCNSRYFTVYREHQLAIVLLVTSVHNDIIDLQNLQIQTGRYYHEHLSAFMINKRPYHLHDLRGQLNLLLLADEGLEHQVVLHVVGAQLVAVHA
jgi:hypothetical protein